MRRTIAAFTFLLLLGCSSGNKVSTGKIKFSDGYTLVWSDEFNNDGAPAPSNWNFESGFVRNTELQWYQDQNAWCKSGLLIIEGRKHFAPHAGYEQGSMDWRK